jgi:hypothetical protein
MGRSRNWAPRWARCPKGHRIKPLKTKSPTPMNGIELLASLFANAPDPTAPVGKAGGRIGGPANVDASPELSAPLQWLKDYGVPIIQAQDADIPPGVAALFKSQPARVIIPLEPVVDADKAMWFVWHEVGHAADFVYIGKDFQPHELTAGRFSGKHVALLRQHQEEIIKWSPHPDRKYKTNPEELWAEVVACAICDPARMPPGLLPGVRSDLDALKLPVGDVGRLITQVGMPPNFNQVRDANAALEYLAPFMSNRQRNSVRSLMRGEEAQFFIDKMIELAAQIKAMPKTYDQDGLGDKAIAHLHYFAGGQANWYITEKDKNGGPQHQAFGLADLFGDGGEFGYISIAEIIANNGELDFHWTPKTIAEIRGQPEPELTAGERADLDAPAAPPMVPADLSLKDTLAALGMTIEKIGGYWLVKQGERVICREGEVNSIWRELRKQGFLPPDVGGRKYNEDGSYYTPSRT